MKWTENAEAVAAERREQEAIMRHHDANQSTIDAPTWSVWSTDDNYSLEFEAGPFDSTDAAYAYIAASCDETQAWDVIQDA